jgi:hypothetical protein
MNPNLSDTLNYFEEFIKKLESFSDTLITCGRRGGGRKRKRGRRG